LTRWDFFAVIAFSRVILKRSSKRAGCSNYCIAQSGTDRLRKLAALKFRDDVHAIHPVTKRAHLSALQRERERNHAHRRVLVFLRMPELRRIAAADAGSLLRFLFLWQRAVSADAGNAARN